jgi:hypothetical protein
MVQVGAHEGGINVDFRKIRTTGELTFEIKRTEEVISFLRGADSITVCAEWYDEEGQTKTKRELDCTEIGEGVEAILARRSESLRADLRVIKGLALRKEAGLMIDPATAEVGWSYGHWFDPYRIDGDLHPETPGYGQLHWARSPGSDMWVWFGDLPKETAMALWDIIEERGAPEIAGIPGSSIATRIHRVHYSLRR